MKQYGFILTLTALLFVLLVVTEWNRPKPIDWRRTYSEMDKIPYGNFILHDLLPELFPEQDINIIRQPIYSQLVDNDSIVNTNYILINDRTYPDFLEAELLLDFVDRGNNVFLATKQLSGHLQDTLQIETMFNNWVFLDEANTDSLTINFTHPNLQTSTGYPLQKQFQGYHFTAYDTALTQVLGMDHNEEVNFIKTNWGKGAFYIHVLPEVFSNYYMLYENTAEYISKSLSHLPIATIYWDEYYKLGQKGSDTPLRYVLSQTPLRWALYLSLGAMLCYVLFEGKRRQRIIPTLPPIINSTVAFTKTVGSLYYKNKNHKDMAEKKIRYFLEHIRQKYFFRKTPLTADFFEAFAQKSGIDLAEVEKMGKQMQTIHAKARISEDELKKINKCIDEFYKRIN